MMKVIQFKDINKLLNQFLLKKYPNQLIVLFTLI